MSEMSQRTLESRADSIENSGEHDWVKNRDDLMAQLAESQITNKPHQKKTLAGVTHSSRSRSQSEEESKRIADLKLNKILTHE